MVSRDISQEIAVKEVVVVVIEEVLEEGIEEGIEEVNVMVIEMRVTDVHQDVIITADQDPDKY